MNSKRTLSLTFIAALLLSCGEQPESTTPQVSDITESVYSSGIVISKDQYSLYARVSGVVKEVLVENGDIINKGDTLLILENKTQQISNENAQLSSNFYSFSNNKDQLANLENNIRVAKQKKEFDSLQFVRQMKLYEDGVGVKVEMEMSKLSYENSVINYNTAINQLSEFKRQLNFNSSQARNNLKISSINEDEFILTSEMQGRIYSLDCSVGELVSPQRPLGVIGSANEFVLEMLIDESDIMDIHIGQEVVVSLDSYEEKTFDAFVTKINPLMDLSSKSFKIEAEFVVAPEVLYPNMNFEANIIINTKEEALVIPRVYLVNDNTVILEDGDSVTIETGLKDYQMIEVLSGLTPSQRIIMPQE